MSTVNVTPAAGKGLLQSPCLVAAFRPFYLLGAVFGVLVLLKTVAILLGWLAPDEEHLPLALWHGHELVFGFSGAIVMGFILTALPGWAGTHELARGKLLGLIVLWGLGRIVFAWQSQIPLVIVAVVDSSPFLVASLMLFSELIRAKNRWFIVVLVIFSGFWISNLGFYLAIANDELVQASMMLKIALMAIIFKLVVVGGFLTIIFSNNLLESRSLPAIRILPAIEVMALLSLAALFATLVFPVSPELTAVVSLLTCLCHTLRLVNMRGWLTWREPLLLAMNLAYGWMVISFLLKALGEFGWVAEGLWLHAFTVGAMGTMMISLMTRVALRHTGRPVRLGGWGKGIFVLVSLAAMLRLVAQPETLWMLVTSALFFCTAFLIYVKLYGAMLLAPSLPKKQLPK